MSQNNSTNPDLRAYFLQQGKSISILHDILSSNVFVHYLKKWFSILVELSLYFLFLCLFFVSLYLPMFMNTVIYNNGKTSISLEVWNEQISPMLFMVSALIILISLPILLFAILLHRNRKKNKLIHEAFTEVAKMKRSFDGAVKDLNF